MEALVREFDGKRLEFRQWQGRPCVAARDLGAVLGYADGARLVDQVRGPWRDEFIAGHDVDVLSGGDLAAFGAGLDSPDSGESKNAQRGARAVVVLYETGARLAAMKARTKVGAKVRRWLVEVWAEIARTGQFRAAGAPPAPATPAPPAAPIDGPPVAMTAPHGRTTALVRWHRGRPCVTAADLARHLHISREDLLVAMVTRGQYGRLDHGVDFAFVEGAELVTWARAQDVDLEPDPRPVMVLYETGVRAVCRRGTQTEARAWLANLWREVPTPPAARSSAPALDAPPVPTHPAIEAEADLGVLLGSHFAWRDFLKPEALRAMNAEMPGAEHVHEQLFAMIAGWRMPPEVEVSVASVEALARFARRQVCFPLRAPTERRIGLTAGRRRLTAAD